LIGFQSCIARTAPPQVFSMTVTDFKTKLAGGAYNTPTNGPAAVAEANAMQANAQGTVMGFDVATQTYTLGLTLDWYAWMVRRAAARLAREIVLRCEAPASQSMSAGPSICYVVQDHWIPRYHFGIPAGRKRQ
jgi:hypothetical protein